MDSLFLMILTITLWFAKGVSLILSIVFTLAGLDLMTTRGKPSDGLISIFTGVLIFAFFYFLLDVEIVYQQ